MAREEIPMVGSARDSLIGICFLWTIFGVVVFFRLLGRIRGVGIGADDVLSLAAFLLSGCTIGLNAAVFTSGVGHNFDMESPLFPKLAGNMEFILKITFIFTLIYLWTLACLKLSQLCFYNRAFGVQLKVWIYGFGAIVAAWGIIFTFIFIFLCDPVAQQWTIDRIGHCMDQILVLKCIIMTNVVTDLMIIILPIRTVWNLQMRKTEKFAVLSCFAIGLACVIIGIVRFWQIFVIDLIGNLTGTSLMTFMLCSIELMLAGICINIPMLRPFYLRWRQRSKISESGSRNERTTDAISGSKSKYFASATGKSHMDNNTWIELDAGSNDDDGGSERKLTCGPNAGIYVSTNFSVDHS
ncbi:integral membrane [Corynascus novoguineensis]|uniref:Integral membrane n=1 Tax=Corynascus novoguineensis TaxID=1126955 RepID=A0AAN7CUD2_9PEZI|nr:integral membrane [Corynascus novoguineensis]